jgi:FG-GAP-like repeat
MRWAPALSMALAPVLVPVCSWPLAARTPLPVPGIVAAALILPTDRYDHAVLGDALEWGGLRLTIDTCPPCADRRLKALTLTLPASRVFEDVTARVVDVTGDGLAEVVVVETDLARGASLAVYDAFGRRVATPFIGQTHRWLAPAGVGDFDGDGRIEIAYIDRPHLLRDLVFLRLDGGRLREIARLPGLTNHRIGDRVISGGTRNCGSGDELVLSSANGSRAMVATMSGMRDAGPISAMDELLACRS